MGAGRHAADSALSFETRKLSHHPSEEALSVQVKVLFAEIRPLRHAAGCALSVCFWSDSQHAGAEPGVPVGCETECGDSAGIDGRPAPGPGVTEQATPVLFQLLP